MFVPKSSAAFPNRLGRMLRTMGRFQQPMGRSQALIGEAYYLKGRVKKVKQARAVPERALRLS